jgi:hypothetical protein
MDDDRVICVETADGLKPIESTGIKKCLRCDVPITEEHDSGWEAFVEGRMTQSICKQCEAADEQDSFFKQTPQELFRYAGLLVEASIEELEHSSTTQCAITNMKRLQRLLAHFGHTIEGFKSIPVETEEDENA